MNWVPLLSIPIEWAALALLVVACLYWERAGFSGLGVEGAFASAMVGLVLGYEWTSSYSLALLIAAGAAAVFALAAGGLLRAFRTDTAIGALALSLVPVCALQILYRSGPALTEGTTPPGLIRGTGIDGTYAEDLALNPMLWAAPLVVILAGWILRNTPFGLRVRAPRSIASGRFSWARSGRFPRPRSSRDRIPTHRRSRSESSRSRA